MKLKEKGTYWLGNFMNNRPLCFLAAMSGLRDFLLGLAFLLPIPVVQESTLYENFDSLTPGWTGPVAGALLLIGGLFVMIIALIDHTFWVRIGLRFQAFLWLFAGILYAINNNWIFSFTFGIYFSVVSGYLAYYYKYAPLWESQKKSYRDEFFAKHDHLRHITDRA